MTEKFNMVRTDENCWDSGLQEKILTPISKKALDLYGDKIKRSKKVVVDGYKVELINNHIIKNDLFPIMYPHFKDAEKMINIQIEIKGRIYIGALYYLINGEWVKDND